MSWIFDYENGELAMQTSDNMAFNSDGEMLMRIGDNMALDLDSGELHIVSGWLDDEN